MTPKTMTTKSVEFNQFIKVVLAFNKKYPIMAEAPVIKTFPMNSNIDPRAVSNPNYIGFENRSFIESIQDIQKFLDYIATSIKPNLLMY